ncbi:MAG: sugar MFS transporter [Bacteroidota bacterium]
MGQEKKDVNYTSALFVLTLLFFMWGFITCMNDILIPYLRKLFDLQRWQSMLVQFTFFTAYFVGSLIYFLISARSGDPIAKKGYKNGILLGLFISAGACLLIFPAAACQSFALFLIALFILGLGFTLLQIAANPYVALLGKPETASSRLNLSQAFNSFGTTIAPIIGGFLVFDFFAKRGNPLFDINGKAITNDLGEPLSAASVQMPYLIFAVMFILVAIIIGMTRLPRFANSMSVEQGIRALRFKQLYLGMIAIFVYVGAEVAVGSAFINYSKESLNMPEMQAKAFLAFYWGGLMIGRFLGAISLSSLQNTKKYVSMLLVSGLTFLVIFGADYFVMKYFERRESLGFTDVLPYFIFLLVNYVGFILGKSLPGRTLMIFSFIAMVLLGITLSSGSETAFWAIIGLGLFNSIMWSNIFTLAIDGLGKHTSQGSSLLVMMILGGAVVPVVVGGVADMMGGYHYSFFIPIICYMYLAYYGWKGYKPSNKIIKNN